jgi:hypothetical protein
MGCVSFQSETKYKNSLPLPIKNTGVDPKEMLAKTAA